MTGPLGAPADPPPRSEPTAGSADEQAREALLATNRRESEAAWRSIAYLLTGPLIYGGVGWLIDRWLGTSYLVGVGIVAGMALSIYLIWFRYGTDRKDEAS